MRCGAAHFDLSINSSEVNVRTCFPMFVDGIKHGHQAWASSMIGNFRRGFLKDEYGLVL
jgi:hypothetical protein